jgi:K+-transporting ATPase ATPase C chain
MIANIRACLWLLSLTVLLCCVVYPLILWGVGLTVLRASAEGSLVSDEHGKVRGSRLIAQAFSDDKYFQPRPSAASYNAAASGASNFGASNPLLRDRVARQLGPLVKFKSGPQAGKKVGPSIEEWFARKTKEDPGYLEKWASSHTSIAESWAKSDDLLKAYILDWADKHPEITAGWRKDHPDTQDKPKPEELVGPFLKSYAAANPGTWPSIGEVTAPDGKKEKAVKPAKEGSDIQAGFFDQWLQDNPNVDLEKVPADLVMTSGSGLDPHITLRNARYQLEDHVADAWAKETGKSLGQVLQKIEALLQQHAFSPLGGLAGEPLVNVLEVNLALEAQLKTTAGR